MAMEPFLKSPAWAIHYSRLSTESGTNSISSEDEKQWDELEPDSGVPNSRRKRHLRLCAAGSAISVIILVAVYLAYRFGERPVAVVRSRPEGQCVQPVFRHEWRSFSQQEKLHYISSVQCLRSKPSRLGLNHSLYDDFPYVHSHIGDYAHNAAAFVVWHRRFIYIYEEALKKDCGYQGQLPYWDWTLDWRDITQAPVWDDEYGFGGNGNPELPTGVREGLCVTSGPFANLPVLYDRNDTSLHCLSRNFAPIADRTQLTQSIRPESIESLMLEDDYDKFNLKLEETAHNTIPKSIRGDFAIFTAPYDPIFFLHHAQLDRLWSKWQRLDPDRRTRQYAGLKSHYSSTQRASLQDTVPAGGLARDVRAREVLDQRREGMCYEYL